MNAYIHIYLYVRDREKGREIVCVCVRAHACVRVCTTPYIFNIPLKGKKLIIGMVYSRNSLCYRNLHSLANGYIDIIKIHAVSR